jgi:hypothetical protein
MKFLPDTIGIIRIPWRRSFQDIIAIQFQREGFLVVDP